MDQVYGGFMVAFEYQRSFDASQLARGLFGSNVLNFAGSQVASPVANSLLADNFGLSPLFQGSMALKPIIQSYNLHFDWFVGLDEWAKGLYLQFDFNFEQQKRELQADCSCSTNITTSNINFPAGYMSVSTSPVTPITSLQTALGLQTAFGNKNNPTTFGRFEFCDRTQNGVAGLSMNLGYDFVRCDNYFLGAFFRVVAPTGSKVQPCYVFDPIVGNGKGWELGAGISSRWEMWNNNDCQKLTAMLDGYAVSILKHKSLRTFDLASTNTALAVNYACNNSCNNSCNTSCNTGCSTSVAACNNGCSFSDCSTICGTTNSCNTSCNSGCNNCNAANCLTRYSLLKQFNVVNGVYTYANNLITAADFTTRNVDVRTSVKGDATIRLVYEHGGFDFGIGYNVFGMSREKISSVGAPSSCIFTTTGTVFGVKGCQGVGYNSYVTGSGTGSNATINSPVNVTALPLVNTASQAGAYVSGCGTAACSASVDNASTTIPGVGTYLSNTPGTFNAAYNSNSNNATITAGQNVSELNASASYVQPESSTTPVVLIGNVNELDLCSGTAPRQFSNKGFITLDYTWIDNDWAPYLGFMAEVEGGSRNLDLAQWGVVIRGGISY